MTRGPVQHIVPISRGRQWAVKSAGNPKPIIVVSTQKQAINIAENRARGLDTDTKVHGRNGKIRAGNSYGNDPFPPRDKK